jgi:tetratricopeptide (TPR) repeat protein
MLPLLLALQVSSTTPDRVDLLRTWVAAVEQHQPGQRDAALETARALDLVSIESIDRHLAALIKAVADPRATIFPNRRFGRAGPPANLIFTNQELERLRALAAEVRARGSANRLLKRAAVLHADIAMSGGSPGVPARALRRAPLRRTAVFVEDGRETAILESVDHWGMARAVISEVASRPDRNPDPQKDPDVLLWYQATWSFMLVQESIGLEHFTAAVALFPREADILFAAGAARDMLSAPGVHAPLRRARAGFGSVMDLGSQESEMRQGVAFYRRALESDRGHAEALIRLGGLLGRLGRHDDAAAELRRALPLTTEPLLQYYAQMFLGRELDHLGDLAGARAAYERAMALAPQAQSPRVGLSQILMRAGDRSAALDLVLPALDVEALQQAEPMWNYYTAAGREAAILVRRVYDTLAGAR